MYRSLDLAFSCSIVHITATPEFDSTSKPWHHHNSKSIAWGFLGPVLSGVCALGFREIGK